MGHGICVGLAVQSHSEDGLTAGPRQRGPTERRPNAAKFEIVSIGELKTRLLAKLLPLVEEYREKMGNLTAEQGGRLTLEKGYDPKELRRALKAAAAAVNRRVRFPFRGEEGALRLASIWKAGENDGGGGGRRVGRCWRGAQAEARAAEEGEQLAPIGE